MQVPTIDGMAVLLRTWNQPEEVTLVGPYTPDEDQETEVVRPRNVQVLPGCYAALLMHQQGVSAKHAYQEINGAMQACGELDMCRDVLT